jgi:lipopolysaccharide export system protein LptA
VLICAWCPPAIPATPQALTLPTRESLGQLRLSADQLAYQPGTRRIELRGQVALEAGRLRIRAGQLTVLLGERGQPLRLEARGKVSVVLDDATGSADQADVALRDRQVALAGHVHLRLAALGLDLQGDRLLLDLATGRVSVTAARARIAPTGGSGPGPRTAPGTRSAP